MKMLTLLLIFFVGCTPASIEDLRIEGEAISRKLSASLRLLETKEDLRKAVPQLRGQFNQLADLLIEARQFPGAPADLTQAGEELFLELARLYELPGGRELIEMAQNEAVQKLLDTDLKKEF